MRFSETQVLDAGGDVDAARSINTALNTLAESRRETLIVDERLIKSKVAWKFASLRQSLTYRLVDLAEATIGEWCAGNFLAAIVLARSFLETAALVHSIVKRMSNALRSNDIGALDQLVTKELFGSRRKDWVAEDNIQATNVLTALDHMSEEIDFIRDFYESLSETAHPNAFGVQQFYATIDQENIVVSYSRNKKTPRDIYESLIVALIGVEWSVNKLNDFDQMIAEIIDFHIKIEKTIE